MTQSLPQLWKYLAGNIQKQLQAVFAIAFPICVRINCDIIQMKMQIVYHRYNLTQFADVFEYCPQKYFHTSVLQSSQRSHFRLGAR